MSVLEIRDVSHAGHELGRARLDGVPAVASLREILSIRIRSDVAHYNTAPGIVFRGLVQPADSVRHSDGHRMQSPRMLDADRFVASAQEAVAAGILWFVLDGEDVADLDRPIDVEECDEIVAVLRRPVVARAG